LDTQDSHSSELVSLRQECSRGTPDSIINARPTTKIRLELVHPSLKAHTSENIPKTKCQSRPTLTQGSPKQ